MKNKLLSWGFVCVSLVFAAGAAAQADTVTLEGSVWPVNLRSSVPIAPSATNADLPLPTDAPWATFTVTTSSTLNFSGWGTGQFIQSGGGVIQTGDSLYLSDPLSDTQVYGTYFSLTGTINIRHGETYTFGDHDGASINLLSGLSEYELDPFSPGPTSFDLNTYTYNGPTMNGVTLQIIFAVCCAPTDARLETNLPTGGNTPEPSTMLLMAGGLAFLGLARHYRLRPSR